MIELVKSACNLDSASALHKSQSETLDLLEQNVYIVWFQGEYADDTDTEVYMNWYYSPRS